MKKELKREEVKVKENSYEVKCPNCFAVYKVIDSKKRLPLIFKCKVCGKDFTISREGRVK